MKNFIYKSLLPGTKIQISTLNRVIVELKSDDDKIPLLPAEENLYWLGGVRLDKIGRAMDADIVAKNYFFLDFDIRQNNPHIEISDGDIIQAWQWMKDGLDDDEVLREWDYCVFTGNGLHVYYFFDEPITDKCEYSEMVEAYISRSGQATLCPDELDSGCINIARLARLPGSVNQKTKMQVKIIDHHGSPKA